MTIDIQQFLKTPPTSKEGRNQKAFSYAEESDTFNYYTDLFDEEDTVEIGSLAAQPKKDEVPPEMAQAMSFLTSKLGSDALVIELGGSKHQRRSGYPFSYFENYLPLDISLSSMIDYAEGYDRQCIACNAEKLPFKDGVVDAVFTHTFLEHPINPDKVVAEIDRILKPGGVVIHSDAWHCRWWKTYGIYGVKKWGEMTFKEKMLYLWISIVEFKPIRLPIIIMKRFFKELFISKSSPKKLIYKRLTPNYELKLSADEDAAGSFDPIDLMRYYESRGYTVEPAKGFMKRVFFNETNINLVKPKK